MTCVKNKLLYNVTCVVIVSKKLKKKSLARSMQKKHCIRGVAAPVQSVTLKQTNICTKACRTWESHTRPRHLFAQIHNIMFYYAPPRGPKVRGFAPVRATRGCICILPHFWLLQVTRGYYRLL